MTTQSLLLLTALICTGLALAYLAGYRARAKEDSQSMPSESGH